ncbi:MAG: hypothetical protein IPP48_00645 [Chitinophagaceae bacterium]|nr:hypothetical protein [Chitinophagaceae bacterium]
MKKGITYSCIILLLAIFLVSCAASCNKKNQIPSLTETYAKADKKPFGGYVVHKQIEELFFTNTVQDKKQPFDKTWDDIKYDDTASLYICITPKLFLSDAEVEAMMDYIYEGNDLFIASGIIDETLTQKIASHQANNMLGLLLGTDTFKNTITYPPLKDTIGYSYYYKPFDNNFSKVNTSYTKVLGTNEEGKPNYIVYFHGKGKLFLHCDPRAFSNYFLLKKQNYKYVDKVLAYTNTRPTHVYWDNYYRSINRRRNDEEFSSLGEILKHPPLATAFWLALALLTLYILFGGKRRQQVIEVVKPNENTTVTFTETIGRLYLQNKDNKNIADKMIMYFNEHIRNQYYLNTSTINAEFITALSRKSGIEHNRVETLYRTIQHAQQSTQLSDFELLSLNEQIQKFYKKS